MGAQSTGPEQVKSVLGVSKDPGNNTVDDGHGLVLDDDDVKAVLVLLQVLFHLSNSKPSSAQCCCNTQEWAEKTTGKLQLTFLVQHNGLFYTLACSTLLFKHALLQSRF